MTSLRYVGLISRQPDSSCPHYLQLYTLMLFIHPRLFMHSKEHVYAAYNALFVILTYINKIKGRAPLHKQKTRPGMKLFILRISRFPSVSHHVLRPQQGWSPIQP